MAKKIAADRLFLLCSACGHHVRLDRFLSASHMSSIEEVAASLASFKCSQCGDRSVQLKEKPKAKKVIEYAATEGTQDRVFHKSTCGWLKNTSSDREIRFSSRDEAIKRGFRPCTSCRP
jgi:hypothetical protein